MKTVLASDQSAALLHLLWLGSRPRGLRQLSGYHHGRGRIVPAAAPRALPPLAVLVVLAHNGPERGGRVGRRQPIRGRGRRRRRRRQRCWRQRQCRGRRRGRGRRRLLPRLTLGDCGRGLVSDDLSRRQPPDDDDLAAAANGADAVVLHHRSERTSFFLT